MFFEVLEEADDKDTPVHKACFPLTKVLASLNDICQEPQSVHARYVRMKKREKAEWQ